MFDKLLFLAFETLDARNVTDPSDLLAYADDVTGNILVPLILFAFFIIIAVGGLFAFARETGKNDFAIWFTIAAFSTTVLSLIMGIKENLINPVYQIILIALTIMGVAFLWFTSNN